MIKPEDKAFLDCIDAFDRLFYADTVTAKMLPKLLTSRHEMLLIKLSVEAYEISNPSAANNLAESPSE